VTIAEEVRALRAALHENTATFGARWQKSGRSIEGWEQGRTTPDPFVLEAIRKLAARAKTKAPARKRIPTR
jgi:DNA-binding transcriptional regulator YiaG